MGTIMERQKKDGATSYTAMIRGKKGGEVTLTLTETFKSEGAAKRWTSDVSIRGTDLRN